MVMTRVKNRSPDMILTAFDEKKDELPPEACRPSKKVKKNNVGPGRTGFVVPELFFPGPDRTGFFVPDLFFGPDRTGSSLQLVLRVRGRVPWR